MIKYVIIICVFFLSSCNGKNKDKGDFVGIWKSDDGAIISLEADGSVSVTNLDLSKVFDNVNTRMTGVGRWSFLQNENKKEVIEISVGKYVIELFVGGSGLLENSPPWKLYTFIGDPDDMNRYFFSKK